MIDSYRNVNCSKRNYTSLQIPQKQKVETLKYRLEKGELRAYLMNSEVPNIL